MRVRELGSHGCLNLQGLEKSNLIPMTLGYSNSPDIRSRFAESEASAGMGKTFERCQRIRFLKQRHFSPRRNVRSFLGTNGLNRFSNHSLNTAKLTFSLTETSRRLIGFTCYVSASTFLYNCFATLCVMPVEFSALSVHSGG